jgi:hypothetical protein
MGEPMRIFAAASHKASRALQGLCKSNDVHHTSVRILVAQPGCRVSTGLHRHSIR